MKQLIKNNMYLYFIFHGLKAILYWLWGFFFEFLFSLKQFFISHIDKNCNNIKKLKDSHKGERCFIVATGPSLTINDLDKLKGEFTISMNSIVNIYDKTDYRPDIYMIQDKTVIEKIKDKINFDDRTFVGVGNMGAFCRSCITKREVKKICNNKLPHIYYLDTAASWYHINFKHSKFCPKFSSKCEKRIYDGCSVTYSAIQLAFYMGFSNIYLVGCDCNYSGSVRHIGEYDKETVFDKADQIQQKMMKSYEVALDYANNNDIRLFNATRGGMLEIVPRKDLDSILKNS